MAEYCSDDDLIEVRPDVLDLGVSSFDDQIEEAGLLIDRVLESRWYRPIQKNQGVDWRTTQFNRDSLLSMTSQLKRLGVFKTLELAFTILMKHRKEDAFDDERKLFKEKYLEELEEVLLFGIDYDWDDDDELQDAERAIPEVRRLTRI